MSLPTRLSDKPSWLRPSAPMTTRERSDLCSLIRRREKLSKTEAKERSKTLIADFERQLGTIYSYDDDATWQAATEAANKAVKEANAAIAARCQELGIPRQFAPGIVCNGWYSRGENAVASRRAELRRMAMTRIAAMEAEAQVLIERHSVELQEQIIAASLTSESAKAFLEQMPKIPALMPTLNAKTMAGELTVDDDDDEDSSAS